MNKWVKRMSLTLAAVLSVAMLGGCGAKEKAQVNVAALNGPTGIGMVKLMEDNDAGTASNAYTVTLAGAPDDIVGKLTSGDVDIAAVPTNLAATLYKKTEGNIQVLALNTMGVLYVVENGDTIHSVADLAGKTVGGSGQGSTPEYVWNYILEQNGVKDVKTEYKSEHSELAALLASGELKAAVLPEPFVTTVLSKNENLRVALNLTEEWNKLVQDKGGKGGLTQGCIVVRKDFAQANPDAVKAFMEDYQASVQYVNENVAEAAKLVEKRGIIASAALAEKAIPNCNIVCIQGQEMKDTLSGFLQVLYDANPKSVGGALPGDDFYYGVE